MTDPRLQYLFDRYRSNTSSYQELEALLTYMGDPEGRARVGHLADKEWEHLEAYPDAAAIDWDFMFSEIVERVGRQKPAASSRKRFSLTVPWRIAAAAIVILALGISYIVFSGGEEKKVATARSLPQDHDVRPGREGAILTLADGRKLVLDDAKNGELAIEGASTITKESGRVRYGAELVSTAAPLVYNTMSTPNGRQYSLVLADGSKIWLNAASSVTFPTNFPGKERKISISGEAYLEVAHDPSKPFLVSANGVEVEVLGTKFNINAYGDEEATKATLLEGGIKIRAGRAEGILRAGQEAEIRQGGLKITSGVDPDGVIAWKEGLFNFEHSDINKILREFARWYDIDVQYDGSIRGKEFWGIVSRNSTLASVMKILKAGSSTGIIYRIEGKKLFVQSANKN
jgi:transmembrane sensor